MSMHVVRHGFRVALVVLALGLPGCSGNHDSTSGETNGAATDAANVSNGADDDGFFTFDEYEERVASTIPQYRWPPNVDVTSDLLSSLTSGERDMSADRFQAGVEHTLIWSWQTCVWYAEWLDAHRTGATERAREALDVMTSVLPEYPQLDSSDADMMRQTASQASLGDPSLVQQDLDVNCFFIPLDSLISSGDGPMATPALSSIEGLA